MTATAAPFGLLPVRPARGGVIRTHAMPGGIASGYATKIGIGDPVKLVTGGTIERLAAGEALFYGVFAGCEFDAVGRFDRASKFWPASQVATNIIAYVYRDPDIEYAIQANATQAITAIGDEADLDTVADANAFGFSVSKLGALVGAGVSAQFRITGLHLVPGNAWGDAFPIVTVVPNELAGFAPGNAV